MSFLDTLRSDAAALLKDGRAKIVLGYRARNERRIPVEITDPANVDQLVFDPRCMQNLAAYLRKPEIRRFVPVAILAKPAVMRSLLMLQAEKQITSQEVVILAVGVDEYHGVKNLEEVAALLKERYADLAPEPELLARVAELAAMTPEQRAAFWTEQFSKCTRCYACRAACPGCYCTWCVAKKNTPQWISMLARKHGNFAWHMIRAYHQAGRCTLCGACEAACLQGVPLMLLNIWIEQQVREEFDCRPGYDPEDKPLIGTWSDHDDDKFVR